PLFPTFLRGSAGGTSSLTTGKLKAAVGAAHRLSLHGLTKGRATPQRAEANWATRRAHLASQLAVGIRSAPATRRQPLSPHPTLERLSHLVGLASHVLDPLSQAGSQDSAKPGEDVHQNLQVLRRCFA